jgi:hypothetical protein
LGAIGLASIAAACSRAASALTGSTPSSAATTGTVVHTGQLFFDDALTASVYQAAAPYDTRPTAFTTNASDGIFAQEGSSPATLTMKRRGDGFVGSMTMGIKS